MQRKEQNRENKLNTADLWPCSLTAAYGSAPLPALSMVKWLKPHCLERGRRSQDIRIADKTHRRNTQDGGDRLYLL